MTNLDLSRDSYWQRHPLLSQNLVVLIPVLALLLVVLSFFVIQHQLSVARIDFTQSLKAIDTLHLIHKHILLAENGVRDFILTGREDALTPLETAQQEIPYLLNILEDLLVDDPQQIAVLEQISSSMEDELSILETLTHPDSSLSDLLTSNYPALALFHQQMDTLLDARLIKDFEALRQAEFLSLGVSSILAILGLGGALTAVLFSRGMLKGIKKRSLSV